jgi:hypothetical protein
MGKRYVCKECSGEVTLSHYSLPKDGLCPSCRDAAREVKKALIEEQKNFKTCIRCDSVFDKREAENPRAHTCPTCLEVEALEKQKKKEAYEFFNHKRRTLWARTFIMRVHETVSDYESCERDLRNNGHEKSLSVLWLRKVIVILVDMTLEPRSRLCQWNLETYQAQKELMTILMVWFQPFRPLPPLLMRVESKLKMRLLPSSTSTVV